MRIGSSIFRGEQPGWANACVGENGSPGYLEYAKGFSSAANLLIGLVIKDKGVHLYVDEFIYPICFNMRHSIELRLKGLVEAVHEILDIKGIRHSYNLSSSHDIGLLWRYLKDVFERADARFAPLAAHLNNFVNEFADVDATGQTFRYPISNESQKHLVEVSTINIAVLKVYFTRAENHLDGLDRFAKEIRDEYITGTFTPKLSRKMLFDIAGMLPARSLWTQDGFKALKIAIKEQFQIGSKEFAEALNLIQRQYQMAKKIDSSPALLGVNSKVLHGFFDLWTLHHNPDNIAKSYIQEAESEVPDIDSMLQDIKDGIAALEKSWGIFKIEYSLENLAGIAALFYFARNHCYVEDYERQYSSSLAELNALGDIESALESYRHLVNKVNALENVSLSLYALGYTSLADELVARFDFGANFHWLNSARSGELFDEPWKKIVDRYF